jgi:hypothetical protein
MQPLVTRVIIDTGTLSPSFADLGCKELRKRGRPRLRKFNITVISSLVCAALVGCCQPNDPSCRTERIGPSGVEVFGVAIGVGAAAATAITLEVHHAHHTLKGCVSSAPGGLELHTAGGNGTYRLVGSTDNIKAGNRVSLHGRKVKRRRDSTAVRQFEVEHENKDYGPCKLNPSTPASVP